MGVTRRSSVFDMAVSTSIQFGIFICLIQPIAEIFLLDGQRYGLKSTFLVAVSDSLSLLHIPDIKTNSRKVCHMAGDIVFFSCNLQISQKK